MLGQCNLSFKSPLQLEKEYKIDGKINSLKQKISKKLGRIKILDFTLSMFDNPNSPLASVNYIWILPEKET